MASGGHGGGLHNTHFSTLDVHVRPARSIFSSATVARTRGVPRDVTCLVPSRWLRECRPSGPRPLLGLNLRGKNLLRSHPPRIQRRSCLVLQDCVLRRRRTLPSSAPETQPHLPSGALLFI